MARLPEEHTDGSATAGARAGIGVILLPLALGVFIAAYHALVVTPVGHAVRWITLPLAILAPVGALALGELGLRRRGRRLD